MPDEGREPEMDLTQEEISDENDTDVADQQGQIEEAFAPTENSGQNYSPEAPTEGLTGIQSVAREPLDLPPANPDFAFAQKPDVSP